MSSSGLIYAVIVGAWAAYLVPMWLRRQDELNESRPTERFTTAIRLLSGRGGLERRYAKDRDRERREARESEAVGSPDDVDDGQAWAAHAVPPHSGSRSNKTDDGDVGDVGDEVEDDGVDVRSFANPVTGTGRRMPPPEAPTADEASTKPRRSTTMRTQRAKVLARRRRTTMVLFLAFTVGSIVAAVGGIAFLWAPAVPAVLLSTYIAHLRGQERRRFAVAMDRRRAETAATRLRERRGRTGSRPAAPEAEDPGSSGSSRPSGSSRSSRPSYPSGLRHSSGPGSSTDSRRFQRTGRPALPAGHTHPGKPTPSSAAGDYEDLKNLQDIQDLDELDELEELEDLEDPNRAPSTTSSSRLSSPSLSPSAAERQALVEQTDHAEWVDQERERDRGRPETDGWEPTPVPLPTYVSAPVAPRTTRGVDLGAPDAWSSARSSSADRPPVPAPEDADDPDFPETSRTRGARDSSESPEAAPRPAPHARRRPRDRGRTPLFDQYADDDRPRAANE